VIRFGDSHVNHLSRPIFPSPLQRIVTNVARFDPGNAQKAALQPPVISEFVAWIPII